MRAQCHLLERRLAQYGSLKGRPLPRATSVVFWRKDDTLDGCVSIVDGGRRFFRFRSVRGGICVLRRERAGKGCLIRTRWEVAMSILEPDQVREAPEAEPGEPGTM